MGAVYTLENKLSYRVVNKIQGKSFPEVFKTKKKTINLFLGGVGRSKNNIGSLIQPNQSKLHTYDNFYENLVIN